MSVAQSQRFRKSNPCPICGGWDQAPRGKGVRCFGFLSDEGAFAHCTREDMAGELPFNANSSTYAHKVNGDCACGQHHDPRPGPTASRNEWREPVRTIVYPIKDAAGQVVAEHIRYEYADGSKSFVWRRNGKNGLQGLPVADLPLYGLSELLAAPLGSPVVVVVEGEKARDALARRGILAVGTVTGAKSTPSDATLTPLLDYEVRLWADNDSDGHSHMERIATRLPAMGGTPKMVTWPDAPPKGDAADFIGDNAALAQLLASAMPYVPPPPNLNGHKPAAVVRWRRGHPILPVVEVSL